MKIFKDLTTMSSPYYLLRDNDGKLLLRASKSVCEEEMEARYLQNKIAFDLKLKEAIKEAKFKEFDEWMNNLIKKNGTTEYQNMKQVIKIMTVYFYTILVVLITVYCMNKDKECCRITAQEVYEYEGWIIKE